MRLIVPPTAEPVDVAFVREHAKLDDAESDAAIDLYIRAARETAEHLCNRAFLTQTWEMAVDGFADAIQLPLAPIQSIESIAYTDAAGSEATLQAADYYLDAHQQPAYLVLAGSAWPATYYGGVNTVRVRFVAGWATPEEVPASIRHWIAIRAATALANREEVAGTQLSRLGYVDGLLDRWRVYA